MGEDEINYSKFPVILRECAKKGEFKFPKDTLFEYDNIWAYRAVRRKNNSDLCVPNREDFRSNAELNIHRVGMDESSPQYYGVSLFENLDEIKNKMKLPKPKWMISRGEIYKNGGPCQKAKDSSHVCWWMYDEVDVSKFSFIKEGL